ncbi:MAG: hypothetical protein HZA90_16765 [Verrucomicrobia bacterium]|nr:hypothetical protein [Verrucomicrobiota bacterium]
MVSTHLMRIDHSIADAGFHPARLLAGLGCCLLLWTTAVYGAETATNASAADFVVTNLARLWRIPEPLSGREQPVRLRVVVMFYDPGWHVLWLKDDSDTMYVDSGRTPLPFKTGQEVEIQGVAPPKGRMLVWDKCTIKVLQESALPPASTLTVPIAQFEGHSVFRATIEGYARKQTENDPSHIQMELLANSSNIRTYILLNEHDPVPQYEEARVRITGLLALKRGQSGKAVDADLWAESVQDVEVLGRGGSDPRFALPRTLIASLLESPANQPVRIVGTVRGQEPGKTLTLHDETGRLAVETWQTRPMKTGTTVEAVGYPAVSGPELRLREGSFRIPESSSTSTVAAATSPESGLPKLRRVDQIKALTGDEAAKGYPVSVQGVVTWRHPNWDDLCLQDGPEGVYVFKATGKPKLSIGDWVRVSGVTARGGSVPMIVQPTVNRLSNGRPPSDRFLTVPQAMSPLEDCRWVALRGYVRSVTLTTNRTGMHRLAVWTPEGAFTACIPTPELGRPLADAVVLLRGVCSVEYDENQRFRDLRLLVPSEDYIEVEEKPPKDAFALPRQPIQAIRELRVTAPRRTHLSGVVTLHRPGHYFYVQDGPAGLLVLSQRTQPLPPGTFVDLVGFPGTEGRRRVLSEPVVRETGQAALPAPVLLQPANRSTKTSRRAGSRPRASL